MAKSITLILCVAGLVIGVDAKESLADEAWTWPFEKPVRHTPPPVSNPDWLRNSIDAFILARLEEQFLTPAPRASRRVLARRVYLDLIGLPPTDLPPRTVPLFMLGLAYHFP